MTSIHSDTRAAIRISARRFESSPYERFWDGPDVVRGVYAGRVFPIRNDDDPAEKYWALRQRAALYDVPERPVEISGPDVVPFLENIFSRRIADLKEGRGRYAIACTPQGGVFMDGVLFHLSSGRYWYVQPDGALETWLVAHSASFDVWISDPRSRVIQIQGPASMKIMNAASDGAITNEMKYFHAGFFQLGGQEVYVSRTGFTGELGYEIYSLGDKTDHPALWTHLMAAGEPHGMEFSCANSMETRRIEAGILDNITDMDMTMTPFEAGLGGFIDMDKEDFVGRAALVDADRKPLFYGIKCLDAMPTMGRNVLDAETVVGRVTAGAYSPWLETHVGYVRFDSPGNWPGRACTLEGSDGETLSCEIVALPFYDPEKKIARGIDTTVPQRPQN